MKYKETGFRALYKHFVAFMLTDNLKQCINTVFPYPFAAEIQPVYSTAIFDQILESGTVIHSYEVFCHHHAVRKF